MVVGIQPFVVVMKDGRTISNRPSAPVMLLRNTRARLAAMNARQFVPRRPVRENPAGRRGIDRRQWCARWSGGGASRETGANGGPQATGPTLLLSGIVLLVTGAERPLLIFGPVRRRLRQLEDAATRIGAGDAAARASEHGGDEAAALARSFNRMAADLQTRAAALAASDQARRQLADVSHELMTPLTAMRGYLETLAMTELRLDPPTRERYLGVVEQETRRMEHIVGDLLDLARLEGGGSVLRREFVDIGAIVRARGGAA